MNIEPALHYAVDAAIVKQGEQGYFEIEGNTLTLKETKVALEGIAIGGKTMCDHVVIFQEQNI